MAGITTEARRIARAVNAMAGSPRTWRIYFDADGRETGCEELQSLRCPEHDWKLTCGQGRRVTQRDVQDMMDEEDAVHSAVASMTPAQREELGYGVA